MMTLTAMPKYEAYKYSGIEWIGDIPAQWDIKRIKYVFSEVNTKSLDGSGELLSVSQYTGVTKRADGFSDNEYITNAESLSGYKEVKKGDLVSNIMLAWNGSLAFSSLNGITSPAYSVYRLKNSGYERYFHYLLRTEMYKAEYKRKSTGVVDSRLRLYTEGFFDIWAILPTDNDKKAIANFLDEKIAKIDEAITIKEKQIELLQERKQIIIQQAVTQGLDPTVPMKDSGVEWIGQIPAHWKIKKVKHLFRLAMEQSEKNNNHELLSVYSDIGVKPRRELEERGNRASTTDGYWFVKKGDIVVNKLLAWMGAIGLSEYDGVTSPAYDILRPFRKLNGHFYHYLFRSEVCSAELKKHSRGIMDMRLRLYFDKFGVVEVPYPPLHEQNQIIDQLEKLLHDLDNGITLINQQIEKLKEYKTTLINSAVTGKIKVV